MNFIKHSDTNTKKIGDAGRAKAHPFFKARDGYFLPQFRKTKSKKPKVALMVAAHNQLRPAICGLSFFATAFVCGFLMIFISSEQHWKGWGIMISTLGFLGSFASTLYFRRKHKEVKALNVDASSPNDSGQENVSLQPSNIVDPLMLRAITHIKFRACDELKEREDKSPGQRALLTSAAIQSDYTIVNSSMSISQGVVL